MEEMLASVQRKYENKVADLQTTVDKLLKVSLPTHPYVLTACPLKKALCFLTSQKRTRRLALKSPTMADVRRYC